MFIASFGLVCLAALGTGIMLLLLRFLSSKNKIEPAQVEVSSHRSEDVTKIEKETKKNKKTKKSEVNLNLNAIGLINNYICTGPREHLHDQRELDSNGSYRQCHCGHSIESLNAPRQHYSFAGNYMCKGPRHHIIDVNLSSLPFLKCYCGHDVERLY